MPKFSFLACLEVVLKFLVGGCSGVGGLRPILVFSLSQDEQYLQNRLYIIISRNCQQAISLKSIKRNFSSYNIRFCLNFVSWLDDEMFL